MFGKKMELSNLLSDCNNFSLYFYKFDNVFALYLSLKKFFISKIFQILYRKYSKFCLEIFMDQ